MVKKKDDHVPQPTPQQKPPVPLTPGLASPLDVDAAPISRREVLRTATRGAAVASLVGFAGVMSWSDSALGSEHMVWQIDPDKCTACGNCATHCVLEVSAVKSVRAFSRCGKCNFCFGFYETAPESQPHAGAESQLCPTDAIVRSHLGGPYYEYTIVEERCIGCALCVKGCGRFGNGSMNLQIRHDVCINCNRCTIADACPSDAFERVHADQPYLLYKRERNIGTTDSEK